MMVSLTLEMPLPVRDYTKFQAILVVSKWVGVWPEIVGALLPSAGHLPQKRPLP